VSGRKKSLTSLLPDGRMTGAEVAGVGGSGTATLWDKAVSTVLLVDDEEGYRTYVKRGLERTGVEVKLAATPDEAMACLGRGEVDLMIVDIRLPEGASGLDLAERVKDENANVALIVITGYSSREYEERSRALGVIEYLEKPFDLRTLEACVQRFLDHCELLRQIRRLEQELASAQETASAARALAVWPIACIADSGELLYATAAASTVLDAVADPALRRPVEHIDESLRDQLRLALPTEGEIGHTTIFRRDGVVSHYTAFLRRVDWREQSATLVFFLDARHEPSRMVDDLWLDIFREAAGLPSVSDA